MLTCVSKVLNLSLSRFDRAAYFDAFASINIGPKIIHFPVQEGSMINGIHRMLVPFRSCFSRQAAFSRFVVVIFAFSRIARLLQNRCMIVFAILVFSVSASASDKDPAGCIKFFDNPVLYNDCLNKKFPSVNGSIPKKSSEQIKDESCSSCDARQRQKVKNRLKKNKKKEKRYE
jgi:hypothetical protein